MKIPGYTIDLEKVARSINKNNFQFVALQVPEGLKIHISKFIEFLENETNAQFFIYDDPCFGACDIVSSDLKNLGVDFAVQIGHTKIPCLIDPPIPTMFVNAVSDIDITKILHKNSIMMDIELLDHVIIGKDRYYSFKEKGII